MGSTILDVTFYSSLQIFNQFTAGSGIAVLSLLLSFICLLFIAWDIYKLMSPVFNLSIKKFRVNDGRKDSQIELTYASAQTNYSMHGFRENKLWTLRLINPIFVVRLIISQYFISLAQKNNGVQIYSLLVINGFFALYMIFMTIKHRQLLKNPWNIIIIVAVEILLIVYFVLLLIIRNDSDGLTYSSTKRQSIEMALILVVLLIIILLMLKLILGLINEIYIKPMKLQKAEDLKVQVAEEFSSDKAKNAIIKPKKDVSEESSDYKVDKIQLYQRVQTQPLVVKRMEIVSEDREVIPELNKGFMKQQPEDPSLSENKQSIDVSSMSRKIDMMYTRTLKQADLAEVNIMNSEEAPVETPRKSKNPSPEIISERKSLIEENFENEDLQSSSRENV